MDKVDTLKKVLVTGAYGFVGTNLATSLADKNKYSLVAVDVARRDPTLYDSFFTWPLIDNIEWDSVDTVVHLAGKAHDTSNSDDPQSYFDVNCGLTRAVFDKFVKSAARNFIFFSSVKAVADTLAGSVLTEDHCPDPRTPYGQSKREAEQYVLSQHVPPGKKVYILRPSMIHGPGNKGNLNLLYKLIATGFPYPLARYNNRRSFSSIQNVLVVVQEIVRGSVEPGTYQVCDDEPVATNELVKLIAKSLGRQPRMWALPKSIVEAGAKCGDVLRLPLNSERLRKLTETYVVSNTKLKAALRIQSLPVAATDGLALTFRSFAR